MIEPLTDTREYYEFGKGNPSVVNQSTLKLFEDLGPADFKRHDPALGGPDVDSYAIRFGNAVDTLVLAPEGSRDVLVAPWADFRTKEARAWRQERRKNKENYLRPPYTDPKTGLEKDELRDAAQAARNVCRVLPLDGDRTETQVMVTCKYRDVTCKGLIDYVDFERRVLGDLKTSANPHWAKETGDGVIWTLTHALKDKYRFQAGFYSLLWGWETEQDEPRDWEWTVVGNVDPFATRTFDLSPARLKDHQVWAKGVLDAYCDCLEADEWPETKERITLE